MLAGENAVVNMPLEDRVVKCIAETLVLPVSKLVPETRLDSFGGFDSLDQIDLVMAIEMEFGRAINEDELPQMDTVQQVIEYVRANG